MKEITIYAKCIDFRKQALTNYDKETLRKDKITYIGFSVVQLEQLKKEYLEREKELDLKIESMYLRVDKTNQKYCLYSQKQQEKMRSLKWFYYYTIEYLERLITERMK